MLPVSWLCQSYNSVQIQPVCLAENTQIFSSTQTTLADLVVLWDKIIPIYLQRMSHSVKQAAFSKITNTFRFVWIYFVRYYVSDIYVSDIYSDTYPIWHFCLPLQGKEGSQYWFFSSNCSAMLAKLRNSFKVLKYLMKYETFNTIYLLITHFLKDRDHHFYAKSLLKFHKLLISLLWGVPFYKWIITQKSSVKTSAGTAISRTCNSKRDDPQAAFLHRFWRLNSL